MSPRRSLLARSLAAVALCTPLAGCTDLLETLDAENVAIAALIKTPDQKKPDSTESIPGTGVVTFQLFFGHIDKSKIVDTATGSQSAAAGAFQANKDALVSLEFTDPVKGATTINVGKTSAEGLASSTSSLDGRLAYVEGEYTLAISYSGKTYRMKVNAAKPTTIQEFAGPADHFLRDWDPAADLVLTRTGATEGQTNPIAFVDVRDVANASTSAWTNLPTDPLGFLSLVLDDGAWRTKTFTVPASTFKAKSAYLVTLTSVADGKQDPTSDKLFVSSTFLAGVADAGGILTK